jgi:hypothetical protein
LNEKFPETTSFVRGDSGFAVPALYDLCEKESVYYAIRLKSNANLQRIAEETHPSSMPSDVTKTECYFEETTYQAKSWSKPRKVIVKSVRPAGELFFNHSFIVTNLVDAFSPKDIILTYQKRGTMENYIKEAKNGFWLNKMNSFWPLCLLATQTVPTLSSLCRIGRRDFYFQAERSSLPPHALDMLVIRIGQLMTGDFHSIRFSALTAAPPNCLRLKTKVTFSPPRLATSEWLVLTRRESHPLYDTT